MSLAAIQRVSQSLTRMRDQIATASLAVHRVTSGIRKLARCMRGHHLPRRLRRKSSPR